MVHGDPRPARIPSREQLLSYFSGGGGYVTVFVVVVEHTLHEERPPLFSTLFSVFFQISTEGGEGHFFFEPAVGLSVNERTCEGAG